MKRLILSLIVLAVALPRALAQDNANPTRVTVNVGAERLESLLTDEQKQSVTHLTVTGTLQEADYAYLRAGLLEQLAELNLRDADIDTIPPYAFLLSNSKHSVSITIILPAVLKHLADNALCDNCETYTFVLTGDYPTLGKNVYNERGGFYGSYIIPADDNDRLKYEKRCILSPDGSILYRSNTPFVDNIPEGIRTIGANAFEHGIISGTAVIPSTVDSIGDRVFANITMTYPVGSGPLPYLLCDAITPPKMGKDVFAYDTEYAMNGIYEVYVPDESVEAYQKADGWNELRILGQSTERPYAIGIKDVQYDGELKAHLQGTHIILQTNKTMATIECYNTGGQKLYSTSPNAGKAEIPSPHLSSPVTIVRVSYADGTSETLKLRL